MFHHLGVSNPEAYPRLGLTKMKVVTFAKSNTTSRSEDEEPVCSTKNSTLDV